MMKSKRGHLIAFLLLSIAPLFCFAQDDADIFGQTIQITTRFSSYVGKPSWLLIIRDVDQGINIPYLFDISRGENTWVAYTFSRNYLITVSNMRMETYRSRYNTYKQFETPNFCHLESNGRIIHGESIFITISGDLSPDPSTYRCSISQYPNTGFTIVDQ